VTSPVPSSDDGVWHYGLASKRLSEQLAWNISGRAYCSRLPVQRSRPAQNGQ
jgi:hypothetical protein